MGKQVWRYHRWSKTDTSAICRRHYTDSKIGIGPKAYANGTGQGQ
jgi:hypothetical protein